MGDVPGLGLSFPPFAAPRWFCPESDDDDEEQQQCFIPAYGRPPFGLYGPYGDPLLVPPRGFTDADSDTRGLSAAWGHRVTAEVSARPALPAPGRPTAAFGPSAPTRRSRGPGSVLPVRPEPPPCFCPPAEPRRDPSRVRGSRRRPHRHPSTAAVWVSQPSPALQRGPGAHSRSAAPLVPQEAEKNAMELLAEEERMKRKAEKKKLKKKVGLCCCGAQHSWASAPPPPPSCALCLSSAYGSSGAELCPRACAGLVLLLPAHPAHHLLVSGFQKQKDRRKQERLEQELRSKQAAASVSS